ncbi:hypothetical protein A9Q81_23985 [Gammaproteobacteria bacterium 42_54_T18]|nr:hypothetical protein A9Q81_23985 [Gammaproteobacteria bacterium 42_54_T18]
MGIEATLSSDSKELIIKVSGEFNFGMDKEFRASYIEVVLVDYVIDMRKVQYMDSSALGMLINMRKTLGNDVKISIRNVSAKVKHLLTISRINKKFTIE